MGFSMFHAWVNVYYLMNHFVATILLTYFTTAMWPYGSYWSIILACSVLPAVMEVAVIISIFCLKTMQY